MKSRNMLNWIKKSLKIPKGGNQNSYIEKKIDSDQKKKYKRTKPTYTTKDRITRTH